MDVKERLARDVGDRADALPGLGHACGHNLIAATSVGAALALAPVADDLGLTVELYGTPAEEGGGGKIEMLDRGAFTGLDLAMMAHPAPVDVAEARPFAVSHSRVEYRGKAAHAAAYPEHGVNAADAFVIAQTAIGLLRQQLPAGARVQGIVTRGGEAPNAIPELTQGRWYVRAETLADLAEIEPRVRRCFEAGALATGCELAITPESQPYAEFRADNRALAAYRRNAEALGRSFAAADVAARMNRASTDMGNVSQVVPAIHPYVGIGSLPALNHQREFAAHCVGSQAERALLDAATALAWTAADCAAGQATHPQN
jgi:amidohydrolase